jgi:hypothetical protein
MKKLFTLTVLLLTALYTFSQTTKAVKVSPADTLIKLAKEQKLKSADILSLLAQAPASTGLTNASLTQFLQSSVTSGTNGGFNFKTTIFGLKYLFSGTKKDSLSGYYLSHTSDRNNEIDLGVNRVSKASDQLSTITFGYKIAINHRDKSIVNFAKADAELSKGIDLADNTVNVINDIYSSELVMEVLNSGSLAKDDLDKARAAVAKLTKEKIGDPNKNKWTDNEFESIFNGTNVDIKGGTFPTLKKKLNEGLLQIPGLQNDYTDGKDSTASNKRYKTIADSVFHKLGYSYSDLHKNIQNEYNTYAKKIEMGSLTTFSLNPGYNVQSHHADTSTFTVRYLKGFGNYKKPWNIDLQGVIVSLRDSAAVPKDFGHNKLKFIAGVNKVFAVDDKANPLLESELAAEYDDVVTSRFAHETKEVFTGNLTTTIHLSKEFSLPLTLKYDVKNPTLFGFLAVQWNLQDSGKSTATTTSTTGKN